MDRHRLDADPNPISILMPIRIRILPQIFENLKILTFYLQQCQFTLFYLSRPFLSVKIFLHFRQYRYPRYCTVLKFSGKTKKFSFSLHFVEMDTDPDPAK